MSQDDLPPVSGPDYYEEEDGVPRRLRGRGKLFSWIGGIAGLLLLVLLALWLTHHNSSGQGGGRHRRGAGGGGPGGPGGFGSPGGPGSGMNQPTTVGIAKATTADLPVQLEELGTVTPAATVTVRPQVSGTITRLLYTEGQLVHRGQVLAIIDPRTYEASLLQARGALIRDQALLDNARVQLQRYDILLKQDSIARQDRDTQAATVKQYEGTVAVDRGQVQAAQINVGYTRVVSPVSGRVGLKVVDIGNYIAAGDTNGLVVVTTLQPIDVEFSVPQQSAPAIQKRVAQGAAIPALALSADRSQTLDSGRFSTLNNQVDTTTGTIKGKARFANGGNQLYPSQFVNVRLTIDTVKDAIVVPPAAVRSGQSGNYVWLLKADRTVTQRAVTTGVTTADNVQIVKGLAIGETVITDGGDRLNEGAKVALPGDKPAAGGWGGGRHGKHRWGGGQSVDAQGAGGSEATPAPKPAVTPAPAQQAMPAPQAAAPAGQGRHHHADASPAAATTAAPSAPPASADQGDDFPHPPEGLTPDQRHAWFREHMANMTDEQRAAWRARRQQMRQQQGGGDGGGPSGGGNGG